MGDFILARKQRQAARDAARFGRYQLLLGAGASVGALNSHGPLPLSRDLVRILAKRYPQAPIEAGNSLPRAYQRAVLVSSPEDLWRTLKEIYGGAMHEAWFSELASLPWRRVWTLNVDDTFENAYFARNNSHARKLQVVHWEDPYSETGDLEVVHLHGHVVGSDPRRLVFSFAEYQSAAKTHPVWDQILGGVLATEPFVIIGARLLDDPDIEALLMHNRPQAVAPSIVIDPYVQADNRWELERLGYIVTEERASDFLLKWRDELDLDDESLEELGRRNALLVPQLTRLESNRVAPPPRMHDYFGGDAPLWSDVVDRRVALLEWMKTALENLEAWLDEDDRVPVLHIVYGQRLTGTSSGLLGLAREAVRLNLRVFVFDKSSRWNVGALIDSVRSQAPTVLLIDGAADFSDDIDRTLNAALKDGASIYIIAAETPQNDLRLEGRLGGVYRKAVTHVPVWLKHADAGAIVDKLESFGRLGSLELQDKRSRIQHFKQRDVFSAMMDVEHSVGFRKRLEGELASLSADWRLDVVLLLTLAAQAARAVGIPEAALAAAVTPATLTRTLDLDEHFSAVVERAGETLLARQRDRAVEPTLNIMGLPEALSKVLLMIQRLAPLSSRQSLQRRNRAPLLVAHLMTCRNLINTFPGQDLDAFYEELRTTFGDWNGRYWEQRAIYAKSLGDWARAESFAARAVSLYDDAFTRTTYGTILLNKAESLVTLRDPAWQSYYSRGREQLVLAEEKDTGNRVTAFAYLGATLAILERLGDHALSPTRDQDIASIESDWSSAYASLRVSLTGEENLESAKRAEKLSKRWTEVTGRIHRQS